MISCASPIVDVVPQTDSPTSPNINTQDSPLSARSRRYALLPPPPPLPEPPSSPPVPIRSPLRPTPRSSVETPIPRQDTTFTKRKHALNELLSSERAYASDLALIRDIHLPLAMGLPAPFPTSLPDGSPSPPQTPQVAPMTKDDTRIIFGNVEELAVFAEVFCNKLEEALHGVLDPNGDGQDHVADVFISIIPHLKPPYTTYITKHPIALAHLNSLPQTPALTTYLAQTHTLAQSYTHAWDLPSLLIKPVQRLLKYPLLLGAIMDDTEPGEAKDKLREARDKVEEVARGVNEGRRRWEVVKNLLDTKHPPPVRIKSMKGLKYRNGSQDDRSQIESLEKRLRTCKSYVHDFAKGTVEWTMSLRDTITQLERWSITFGRVIGLGQSHGSEALDLFTEIVASQITPTWVSLDLAIQGTLMPQLTRLHSTTRKPLLLLDHMHALRLQHLQLLDMPISKGRPPNSLVEASQAYLALDVQLRAELPRYIEILEMGFTVCLKQFADWQARFWREVRAHWVELWDALGVDGDMSAGAPETLRVWWERWEEIDAAAAALGITKYRHDRTSRGSGTTGPAAALATAFVSGAGSPPSFPSTPLSSTSMPHHRRSMQSIDLEIENRRAVFKIASMDSQQLQLSPRVSVHTSSSASTSESSHHRLSTHSNDAHVGMDRLAAQRPVSRTSHAPKTYSEDPASPSVKTAHIDVSRSSPGKNLGLISHDEDADLRGRISKKASMRKRFTNAFKSPAKRHVPRASTSSQSLSSPEFYGPSPSPLPSPLPSPAPDSTRQRIAPYACTVVHPFSLAGHAMPLYRGRPFLSLEIGDTIEVLSEEGHPRDHEELPIRPEDEDIEDCLLLVRDDNGTIGWALASFLVIS
ncbi:hypothetical protein BU17DRAFT_51746 [Hysterangium stoloniferum]|nr:hypothetical protein BU17DRAFT_51746 [Hysterangium stoloniferum]